MYVCVVSNNELFMYVDVDFELINFRYSPTELTHPILVTTLICSLVITHTRLRPSFPLKEKYILSLY